MSHKFKTRLVGVDPNWQHHGSNSAVRYQKLPAGKYTLEVMGLDGMLNETAEITTVLMHVRQPFYKSAWFLGLMVLAFLSGIYLLYRYRVAVMQQQQNMRTRIASDLHDEIGGSLTAVSMQLQLLEFESNGTFRNKLRSLGNKINDSASKMRDLVWSIDTSSDPWSSIIERMQDCAYDLLYPVKIQFSFDVEGLDTNSSPNPTIKQNVYMLFKEAINNIAKHSNASHVEITLLHTQNNLVMRISDNGKNQDTGSQSSGHGMSSMQLRAKRLKGVVHAGWQMNGGYVVELTCPLN
jgi:signal transduction histidine kinase